MSISIDDNIIGILRNTMVKVYENDREIFIPIQNIKKGTCCIIDNFSVFVDCIIKIKYTGPICMYECNNHNIGITPYYPIYYKNKFSFPILENLFETHYISDTYIYNIFLEENHYMNHIQLFGGIYAYTLNHGIESESISYNYFATNRVLKDFKKHPDWENGLIQLDKFKIIRNKLNEIIGIDY